MKKEISKIFVAAGFIVFVIGLLVDSLLIQSLSLEIISAYSILAVFAFAFVLTNNATLNNFGYSFAAIAGMYGIANILFTPSGAVADIGAIIMLAGTVIRLTLAILAFFGYSKNAECTLAKEVDIYDQLLNYSKLLAEQAIDAQEYEDLKVKLLGKCPSKSSKGNVDELKKWKKLVEQNIISKDEYSSIKSKILKIM